MLPARTFSVSIAQDWQQLYERIWQPEFFPNWASGLAESGLCKVDNDHWAANGPEGPIRIRFTPHNAYGIMDHYVEVDGSWTHVPLRVIPNEDGAEVMLTLFRQPSMDDERFAADIRWINRDLKALARLMRA